MTTVVALARKQNIIFNITVAPNQILYLAKDIYTKNYVDVNF